MGLLGAFGGFWGLWGASARYGYFLRAAVSNRGIAFRAVGAHLV